MSISAHQQESVDACQSEIQSLCACLDLDREVQEIATSVCHRAFQEKLSQGTSIDILSGASIYVACRQTRRPRSISEIAAAADTSDRAIGQFYRRLTRKLTIGLPPMGARPYVNHYCDELDVPETVRETATTLVERARESDLSNGKSPTSIAAAAVYTAARRSDARLTQVAVAEVSQVSRMTIRDHCSHLQELLDSEDVTA